MGLNYKKILIVTAAVVLAAGIMLAVRLEQEFGILKLADQFRSFRVTVHNQSDYKLNITAAGVTTSASALAGAEAAAKDELGHTLSSGRTLTIKPELSLSGEGSIYLHYTDPREPDEVKTIGVCSYTEYLSGSSTVTISNDGIEVEENCS
ncbi:hypothetical protein [Paenibacillus sp. MMS20-IR301]|uniref:hypothetical protein n=1 Tax=Paenibacillus sp. MMS20-IR301 TaxID=2895946 RepID=UPI0028EE1C39|nr:hypothetical protein [Paenibacillus sp. MMS20-IR301]WNS43572.1 hypothetical protein LOS79_32340 [Paenibacillus sp. MMS20-IR301]